jgi:radical SAM superfamily enzyme YgiQ (UPF0313 family)
MKILLVAPRSTDRFDKYYDFPLGLAYISSALKSAGFDVECLNLNNHKGSVKELIPFRAVVGTGGLSSQYSEIKEILAVAQKHGATTVLGGGILSSNPEVIFKSLKPDFGVLFEGEETIVELCRCLENDSSCQNVKGLVYWKNGEPIFTPEREPIADLDSIHFPDYEGFGAEKYIERERSLANLYPFETPRFLPIISSRGCPFTCGFCFHPLGNNYRVRSLDNFFSELNLLKDKYGLNMVIIYDELFGYSGSRLKEFCERMKQTGLKWVGQMRVSDKLTDETMAILKDSGLLLLSLGLESAVNTVLASMAKGITIEQTEHTLDLAKKHGIGVRGSLIFGDTAETFQTANQTLDWYMNRKGLVVSLNPIYVYAGTRLYREAKAKGLIEDEAKYAQIKFPVVNVTQVSQSEYSRIRKRMATLNTQRMGEVRTKIFQYKRLNGENGFNVYRVTAECPHCHNVSEYGRFYVDKVDVLPSEGVLACCRRCNSLFTVYFPSLFNDVFSRFGPYMFDRASRLRRRLLKAMA